MQVEEVLAKTRDTISVKRVFGEPFDKDGLTIIPVAAVQGGGGGGTGESDGKGKNPAGKGSGVGFGVNAKPAGAYVIDGGEVTWRPAIDWTRIVLGAQAVLIVALLAWRAVAKARARD